MNGILLIDKPSDWTSNDVVMKLRGMLRERRTGHSGTLDQGCWSFSSGGPRAPSSLPRRIQSAIARPFASGL